MWHWEQGRLEYFQFVSLRRVAAFALSNDLMTATRGAIRAAVGQSFDPSGYTPWRNYARVYKSMFLVAPQKGVAIATPVAALLAVPGQVTSDEFFHFVAMATTEPSPALSTYNATATPRFPLLFAVKYLLMNAARGDTSLSTFDEIIGAYRNSKFSGSENDLDFLGLAGRKSEFTTAGKSSPDALRRQARESLRVMAQISYIHIRGQSAGLSIAPEDAQKAFAELQPIGGTRLASGDAEIHRRAALFAGGSTLDFFDYPKTVVSESTEAGFKEGSKAEKTHLVIERNSRLRAEYFSRFNPKSCDVCKLETAKSYPWTAQIIDLHHVLPLSSGTRTERSGTVLTDMLPVCPTCHRAIHRYYATWLKLNLRRDFVDATEAKSVIAEMKSKMTGLFYAS